MPSLNEIEIPIGKFILLGGGVGGELGFSLCGTFSTVEEAQREKDKWLGRAPFYASNHANAKGENLSSDIICDPDRCLEYLGMTFDIYNDKKERVG
ncbi:MAG: hypothetical protein A3B86_00720 [Candidatus Yanofskybacteria bacterium RIFCSPHIGHO2_02_FULL_38_22b]|uniref:Uncharacterized protein n=1 Tax=Candidatus Yanofskybacteria bacterium RIFCSPHIGHO2_02_FULL_38_22b TaxID=1802673 RepID=A0A1F8F387_9BACT|nr:MAG: hypothetical protein A2816_03545 [Candidatus Yanofskybacteria bacterium RIFCSPHIGHO2_01_FULL_39_44]OGN07602.1 MAG: hypothetical protein A3B86_00720 [Candidatus Yanofskybacteria bacterium RIFCSPHIGHO2_02_FULL_38_22b]OGN20231.1 MAG: hypothetical protein A2910_00255 [Candidatus Yanofskybacteria bacterium RIFCSPLOWO2_01_FULL_39_28]